MHSSPHRNNSDFQLRHFMANSCHTADTAWCLMYEQKLDIKLKLDSTRAKLLRRQARKIELDKIIELSEGSEKLKAQADLIEWESSEGLLEMAILGAEQEIASIQSIMDELEPQRKYGHLNVIEAAQAAQREEWCLEFKRRIENYLMSNGTIPEDQLNTMRNHPDFSTQLIPHIEQTMVTLASPHNKFELLSKQNLLLENSSAS
jgi:hypothetical protein